MPPIVTVPYDAWGRLASRARYRGHLLVVVHRVPSGSKYAHCSQCGGALWRIATTRTVLHAALAQPCPKEPVFLAALEALS